MVSNEPSVIKSVFADITKPSTFMGVASVKTGDLLSIISGSDESAEEDYSNAVLQALAPEMLDLLARVYDVMPVMISITSNFSDDSSENKAIAAYVSNLYDDLERVLDLCHPYDDDQPEEEDENVELSDAIFPENGEFLGDGQSFGDGGDSLDEYGEGDSGSSDSEHAR